MFLHADSEDSDQTGQMPRLIRVFAGHTGHFVGFVKRRLKYFQTSNTHEPVSMYFGKDILFKFVQIIQSP